MGSNYGQRGRGEEDTDRANAALPEHSAGLAARDSILAAVRAFPFLWRPAGIAFEKSMGQVVAFGELLIDSSDSSDDSSGDG